MIQDYKDLVVQGNSSSDIHFHSLDTHVFCHNLSSKITNQDSLADQVSKSASVRLPVTMEGRCGRSLK